MITINVIMKMIMMMMMMMILINGVTTPIMLLNTIGTFKIKI